MNRYSAAMLIGLGLLAASARFAAAQGPGALVLAPGDTVQVVGHRVHEGGPAMSVPGRRLDVLYITRIAASNVSERRAQADRAAHLFGPRAVEIGARRLSIGICDSRECAERKHPPAEWYLYERTDDGWRRVR